MSEKAEGAAGAGGEKGAVRVRPSDAHPAAGGDRSDGPGEEARAPPELLPPHPDPLPPPHVVLWPWFAAGAAVLLIAVGFGVWLLWGLLTPARPPRPSLAVQATSLPTPPKDPPAQPSQDPPHTQPPMATPPAQPMATPPAQPPMNATPPDPPSTPPAPPPAPPPKDSGKPDAPSGEPLPGAGGPRLTYVGKLAAEMKVTDVGMIADLADPAPGKAPTPTFPSGTKELELIIVFSQAPPDGTTLGRLIRTDAGAVDLKGFVFLTELNNSTGELKAMLGCEPESGAFADGNYQTTVKMNDETIAVLNWTVGKAQAPK